MSQGFCFATSTDLLYFYAAKVLRVVDGDTLKVDVSLGFGVHYDTTVRLAGINAPELRGEEKDRGKAAMVFVERWLEEHAHNGEVFLKSIDGKGIHQEKYGRWLAVVLPIEFMVEGEAYDSGVGWTMSLNGALIESGNAKPTSW